LALAAVAVGLVACQPPLDESFGGGDGIVTTHLIDQAYHLPEAVEVQPDGKLVVLSHTNPLGWQTTVARYNPDGSLDASFGDGGIVLLDAVAIINDSDLLLQPDGKILVADNVPAPSGGATPGLMRFNSDGTADTGFGTDGVTTAPGVDSEDLELQADGKILMGGSGFVAGPGGFNVGRFNADGTLDGSFGVGGVAHAEPGLSRGIEELAVQADGKILAAGGAETSGTVGTTRFAFARYNPDGTLDPTFSGDGMATFNLGGGAVGLAVRPDGRFVAVGSSHLFSDNGQSRMVLVQFLPDGSLDTDFGVLGAASAADGNLARDMALLDDGRVLVVGGDSQDQPFSENHDGFILARFTTAGVLDNSFGQHGVGTTNKFSGPESAWAVAVQPDSKMVVVGTVPNPTDDVHNDLGLYRYAP
jgi:uncharacterized delta-60 repeat protein